MESSSHVARSALDSRDCGVETSVCRSSSTLLSRAAIVFSEGAVEKRSGKPRSRHHTRSVVCVRIARPGISFRATNPSRGHIVSAGKSILHKARIPANPTEAWQRCSMSSLATPWLRNSLATHRCTSATVMLWMRNARYPAMRCPRTHARMWPRAACSRKAPSGKNPRVLAFSRPSDITSERSGLPGSTVTIFILVTGSCIGSFFLEAARQIDF